MTTANRSFHRAQSKSEEPLMYEIRKLVRSKLEKRTKIYFSLPPLLLLFLRRIPEYVCVRTVAYHMVGWMA